MCCAVGLTNYSDKMTFTPLHRLLAALAGHFVIWLSMGDKQDAVTLYVLQAG